MVPPGLVYLIALDSRFKMIFSNASGVKSKQTGSIISMLKVICFSSAKSANASATSRVILPMACGDF